MKKSGVLLLFGIIFLFLIEVKGNVLMRNRRCFCIEINQKNIQAQSLKDLKKFVPSPSCEKVEIIATLKNGGQTCLNPDLPAVKKLVKDWEKKISQKKKHKKGGKQHKAKKLGKTKKSRRPYQKKTT